MSKGKTKDVLIIQHISPKKVEPLKRVSFCHYLPIEISIFFVDLWQQEKERCVREKGIKQRVWECSPDCWAYYHSQRYSLITPFFLCSISSASVYQNQPSLPGYSTMNYYQLTDTLYKKLHISIWFHLNALKFFHR